MDYTVHGILQAKILEQVAFLFSRGPSQPKDRTQVSHITDGFFTSWATRKAQEYWSGQPIPSSWGLPDPGIEPRSPALQVDSLPSELHVCQNQKSMSRSVTQGKQLFYPEEPSKGKITLATLSSFQRYLLSIYHMPATGQDTGDPHVFTGSLGQFLSLFFWKSIFLVLKISQQDLPSQHLVMTKMVHEHNVCQWLRHVQLFATPQIVVSQAPLPIEFSRQEYWSGLPFSSPGHENSNDKQKVLEVLKECNLDVIEVWPVSQPATYFYMTSKLNVLAF